MREVGIAGRENYLHQRRHAGAMSRPWWRQLYGLPPTRRRPPARGESPHLGCVEMALGELAAYLLLAIVVGIGAAIIAGLVAAADASPVLGGFLIAFAVTAYIYGVAWTARARPGLYLENLAGEMRDEARSASVGSGAWRWARMLPWSGCRSRPSRLWTSSSSGSPSTAANPCGLTYRKEPPGWRRPGLKHARQSVA